MTSQQARLHESEGNLQQLANAIKESNHIVVIMGAGVSAAAGIPTFLDSQGKYSKKLKEKYDWNMVKQDPKPFLLESKRFFDLSNQSSRRALYLILSDTDAPFSQAPSKAWES
jgi:NAD-dependent SIR2 family protein deacetylase